MAENSKRSPTQFDGPNISSTGKSTTNGGRKRQRVVSKEMALTLLESALSYTLDAGWDVVFDTVDDGKALQITIKGAIMFQGQNGLWQIEPVDQDPNMPIMVWVDTNIGTPPNSD